MTSYHLAQINVGRLIHPLESPETAEFTEALDRINALAEASPGFVWRLTDDDGGPASYASIPGHEDPLDIVNYSIWDGVESLKEFMFKTDHVGFLRRRKQWFQPLPMVVSAGWWIPAGTIPDVEEAYRRLEHLRANGPSAQAWNLNRPEPRPT